MKSFCEWAHGLAYIIGIEPPAYPQGIEFTMAEDGKMIFASNCSKCIGIYGSDVTYPNLLIELDAIGTDSNLAETNWAYPELADW